MKLPTSLLRIAHFLSTHGAKAIVVGGAVRDHFLEMGSKDYDIEVYGVESMDILTSLLSHFGSVNAVGKSFGVLKLTVEGYAYDFSFPRRETKVGERHKDFAVCIESNLPFKEAAKRRDFTINAMGYDIVEKQFLDPYGGVEDMQRKTLRHIDNNAFQEDPLRVYRAVQFVARLGYTLTDETFALCRAMVEHGMLQALPKERIYGEWEKLLLKSMKPSQGFELMRRLGVLHYFPELDALIGVPQSPKWHPEGDVWVHTMLSLDAMAQLLKEDSAYSEGSPKERLQLMFAILCHDLGKAVTTTYSEAKQNYQAIGHEEVGVALTETLMGRLTNEQGFIEEIFPFVKHHLKPSQFYRQGAKEGAIRRLATKVSIDKLVKVAKADFLGRTTPEAKQGVYHAGEWLQARANRLNVSSSSLPNLLQGRDLIALGLLPSKQFGEILKEVYELQLEGVLSCKEKAMEYIKEKYA
jgi:tRNA nucleotidyltransferase (CCA-adding enzyme)